MSAMNSASSSSAQRERGPGGSLLGGTVLWYFATANFNVRFTKFPKLVERHLAYSSRPQIQKCKYALVKQNAVVCCNL
jgi:hypothetical protein